MAIWQSGNPFTGGWGAILKALAVSEQKENPISMHSIVIFDVIMGIGTLSIKLANTR